MSLDSVSQQAMLESLSHRLDQLQRCVAGPSDIQQLQHVPYCALEMTSRIRNQISNYESKCGNVLTLCGRLDELSCYLEVGEEGVSREGMREVVLSRAGYVQEQVRDFERLEHLKKYAGPVTADVNTLQPKVRPLIEVSLQQVDDVQGMTSQVHKVVARYNSVISAISNQFLVWDELLSKLENK